MARTLIQQKRFQGISYADKEGGRSSFLFARSMDYRSNPGTLKILPKTLKVSGSVVADLIMDGDRQSTDAYFYGDAGNIYKRTSGEVWTNEHTTSSSQGNGIKYFGEDSFLYYTGDTVIGRYGPFGGTKTWVDDFLGSEGGVPLNTACLDLESDSSHYATAPDHSSLSITGDITIEICVKMESLPAAAAQMVLVSKWNEQSDERSYKFDLAAVDAVFGDGGDGALTISSNTTQAPTDASCTGTAAAYALSATNASFATGDKILIYQSQGTGAGKWERNEISSYTAGTITTTDALTNTYTSGAQVIVIPEYSSITVDAGKTWTAKAWGGSVGGILVYLCSGTLTMNGDISANGKGFRGGAGTTSVNTTGYQGEGQSGTGSQSTSANGMGGGGSVGIANEAAGGGGGGGNSASGSTGTAGENSRDTPGTGGGTGGTADLTTMVFGGGGGGSGVGDGISSARNGGAEESHLTAYLYQTPVLGLTDKVLASVSTVPDAPSVETENLS